MCSADSDGSSAASSASGSPARDTAPPSGGAETEAPSAGEEQSQPQVALPATKLSLNNNSLQPDSGRCSELLCINMCVQEEVAAGPMQNISRRIDAHAR